MCEILRSGTAGRAPDYFFPFEVDLVCDNALPATLLEFELYLPSRRIVETLEATDLLVCFVFAIKNLLSMCCTFIIPYIEEIFNAYTKY